METRFKARSQDPISMIGFLVPKIGHRFPNGPIQSFVFVGAFHLSRGVSDENKACPISICFFFKIVDLCVEASLSLCSHDPIFGTNKNRIFEIGLCEQAFKAHLRVWQKRFPVKMDRLKKVREQNFDSSFGKILGVI